MHWYFFPGWKSIQKIKSKRSFFPQLPAHPTIFTHSIFFLKVFMNVHLTGQRTAQATFYFLWIISWWINLIIKRLIIELRFVTPVSTPTASFHGDTNGLASIAVVAAVDKVRLIILVPRMMMTDFYRARYSEKDRIVRGRDVQHIRRQMETWWFLSSTQHTAPC